MFFQRIIESPKLLMRITLRRDIKIKKAVREVWEIITDLSNLPKWCTLIEEIIPVGPNAGFTPGKKYVRRFNYGFPFGSTDEIITVLQVIPNHYWAFKHGNIFIKVLHLIYLREKSGETHVVLITVYRGYFLFLVIPLWRRLKNLQKRFLEDLKKYAESF